MAASNAFLGTNRPMYRRLGFYWPAPPPVSRHRARPGGREESAPPSPDRSFQSIPSGFLHGPGIAPTRKPSRPVGIRSLGCFVVFHFFYSSDSSIHFELLPPLR